MLARLDRLPRRDYSYEVKWDGFRAIVSTERGLEVRSRRGREISERVPELGRLPRVSSWTASSSPSLMMAGPAFRYWRFAQELERPRRRRTRLTI
jgi:hypothetical protein